MPSPGRSAALVVHDDGELLDLLTEWLEASEFDVAAAASALHARAVLDGNRRIDVVIAPWDAAHPVGGALYEWALRHRADLRTRFVFVTDEVPPEFDAVVGGRCLTVPLGALDELVQVAGAVVRRARTPPRGTPIVVDDHGQAIVRASDGATAPAAAAPALLLADDDPALLGAMTDLLVESGYAVFAADGGHAAIRALETREFDAIVTEWHMHGGSGAELYRWIAQHRPHLVPRVVFLSESDDDDSAPIAPGRPMFRKGQDSAELIAMLRELVQRGR